MTENSFLTAPAEAVDEPSGGSRRLLILGGSLVAVAALGLGGYTLLGGSGGSTASAPPLAIHHFIGVQKVKPVVTKTSVKTVPAVTTQRIGKDPFIALYLQPAVATAPAAGSAATAPLASSSSTGTTPAAAPTVTTHALKLTRVYGTGKDITGVFTIDGKTQLAKVGTVFGPTSEIKLLSLTQGSKGVWTATAQVGDGQPFDAAIGQTEYVR